MSKKKFLLSAMICSALVLSTEYAAQANASQDEETEFDTVVVTANRIPTKLSETAANVTVITAEEIEKNHYIDIEEALRHVSGVIVTGNGMGTQGTVRINGDERVVIMIDGRRVNNDMGTGVGRASVDLETLGSLENIERIEIVRGATSSLYGSDAIGGAINIITKKGSGEAKSTIDMNMGSWGTRNYTLTNQGSENDVSWFITAGKSERDYFKYKNVSGQNVKMQNSDYNNDDFSVRLDKKIDDESSVTLNVEHSSIDSGQYNSAISPSTTGFMQRLKNDWAISYNFNEDTGIPGYLRYYSNYLSTDFSGAYNTKTKGVEWQNGWQLDDKNRLVGGLEWKQSSSTNVASGYQDSKINNKAIYVEDTMKIDDRWSIIPGVRYDDHNKFGGHISPKISANYKMDDTANLYASWAKVFNAPNTDDLYYNETTYGTYGNPNLNPETGHTMNFGLNKSFDHKTKINFNYFYSDLDNAIVWLADSSWHYRPYNLGNQKKRGFELSLEKTIDTTWSYDVGYSYLKTETNFVDWSSVGSNFVDLSNSKPNGYNIGIHYNKDAWKANLLATAATGRSTTYFTNNSCWIWDANVSYQVNNAMTAYLKVNNITNEAYEWYGSKSLGAYPMPGRSFQLGVKYTF